MLTAEEVKGYILAHLPCEYLHVEGDDGEHFSAVIVSPEFTGKNMVQQHQRVYQALGARMEGEIHALSMRTFTPEEWKSRQADLPAEGTGA